MATFVLVHGAWHGGWCWNRVASLLRSAGHDVYTPTLTGLGERSHLLTPGIGLETHIQDVVNVLEFEDLRDTVLVGHSYAGMVITGVADRAATRLARLVYLDAYVPKSGESLTDQMSPERRKLFEQQVQALREGYRLQSAGPDFFGITDPDDVEWATARLVDHPVKTYRDKLNLTHSESAKLPRTFIWAKRGFGFNLIAERLRGDPGWAYHELDTGHDVMVTMPAELAHLLVATA